MRILKSVLAGVVLIGLAIPAKVVAAIDGLPDSTNWYFHVDLEKMAAEDAGKGVYDWLKDEVFDEVEDETGVDLAKELDRLTSFSAAGESVVMFEGDFSQATRDLVMTFVASGGDIDSSRSSGKTYFHFGGNDDHGHEKPFRGGNIKFDIHSLSEESWVSMDLKNKIVITATEDQMKTLLASNGKVPGARSSKDALVVLTAEKPLVQAGLDANALTDEDGGWNSNILRNTEHAAFLIAAAADKLLVEASLVTTESEMAESLASVVRGLISLAAFNDDMDEEAVAILRGTKVETKDNNLSISLAVDPNVVVATLSD